MRTFILIPVLGALAAAAAGAAAQTIADEQQPISEIRISPNRGPIKMWPDEMREVAGLYPMSDNQALKLSVKGTRLYAQLNDRSWTQLRQIAPNVLVSQEQGMSMVVNYGQSADQVRLTYYPDQQSTASATPVTTVLVAQR